MRKSMLKIAALLLINFMLPLSALAQIQPASTSLTLYEPKLKAGLVYNFLKYTTWPQNPEGRLEVCLYGGDSFNGYLYPLKGRTAQQYVISITSISSIPETAHCDFLFINKRASNAVPQILKFLQGKHVLTASDIPSFASQGGMIEFGMENQRISVNINQKAVNQAGLHIHDRLLKLAHIVAE
jgi:hypothetical protein